MSGIAHGAVGGVGKGGCLLSLVNLWLGERFEIDAVAALVRDENNWPRCDDTDGDLENFPLLDDHAGYPHNLLSPLVMSFWWVLMSLHNVWPAIVGAPAVIEGGTVGFSLKYDAKHVLDDMVGHVPVRNNEYFSKS